MVKEGAIIGAVALGIGALLLTKKAGAKEPECEFGFHLENGKCVPNEVPPTCGDGFHLERINGLVQCVPDDKPPLICGVGEVKMIVNGVLQCVKQTCPTDCPPNHHVENCKCVVNPPEPLKPVIKSFSYNPKSGVSSVNVSFNLSVNGTRNQINWDFGDGSPIITGQTSPRHEYFSSTKGSVTVLTENGRSEKKEFSITVTKRDDVEPKTKGLITNVSLSKKEGIAPLQVNASVSGTRRINNVWWDFGDGLNGHGQSKTTVYNNKGVYNGSVTVTFDNGDFDTETFTVIVNLPTFTSKIKFWDTGAKVGKTIIFGTSGSGASGSIKYKWNFGDGKVETVTGVTQVHHVYTYADKFKVSLISTTSSSQSDNDEIFITVKGEDRITPPPIQCNTGFHLENGICVRDEVDPPVEDTQIFKGIVARSGRIEKHPTAFSSTYLLANYALPSKVKKIKYARIYFNAKADNYGTSGGKAVIKFNGSNIGTVNWKAFEDGKSIKLDPIVVTNKMKKTGYNKLEVTYIHNNNLFGQPLASGFIVNGSDLYVEYEY